MATFYVKNEQIKDSKIKIMGDDYSHLKNVLRAKIGEKIDVCDENGSRYKTKISTLTKKEVICEIIAVDDKSTEPLVSIDLYQGLPKADKLELIIQKSTEIGVKAIFPVQMARTIVKFDERSSEKKLERWNKISAEASKQCGRQKIPKVHEVINFKNSIENISKYDIVLLPYENEKSVTIKEVLKKAKKSKAIKEIAVMIGPEGGFSEEEINILNKLKNVHTVTLGPRILRTETAGLVTLAMILYEFEL